VAAAVLAGAALTATLVPAAAVPPPSAPPAESATPGTPITVQQEPDGWHRLPGGWIIDYWTVASNGRPVQASGALFLPPGPVPEEGRPMVAYDHGTTGLGSGCGGISNPEQGSEREDALLEYFLSKGFAVVAPDYLGLGRFRTGPHPYLELRSEATATIDLVRAARSLHPELSRTWVAFGASQGGQAALGTAVAQQTLAPDLDFRGSIADDPESDVEKVVTAIGGPGTPDIPLLTGPTTGLMAMILDGLRATHPEVDVDSYLTPLGRKLVDDIGELCLPDIVERSAGVPVGALVSRPLNDEAFRTAIRSYMEVPTSGYRTPILLLLNADDTVVPSPLHIALAAQLAAGGNELHIVPGAEGHSRISPEMWAAMDEFLARAQPPRP
jgi:pimeloyl-ACP methyl ester carboxylesterase